MNHLGKNFNSAQLAYDNMEPPEDPEPNEERVNEIIDEMLKSDSFGELLSNEEVNLSVSNFIKELIQQDMSLLCTAALNKSDKSKKAFIFNLLFIDLEHIKEHLRNAARPAAEDQVIDEILHPKE